MVETIRVTGPIVSLQTIYATRRVIPMETPHIPTVIKRIPFAALKSNSVKEDKSRSGHMHDGGVLDD